MENQTEIILNIDKSGMGTVKLNGIDLEKYIKGFTIVCEIGKPTICSFEIIGDVRGQVVADLLFAKIVPQLESEYGEPGYIRNVKETQTVRESKCECVKHIGDKHYEFQCPIHRWTIQRGLDIIHKGD